MEVFSEGNENDTKPEPETEEFAVICREAGWELVSSRKKLCIFRKIYQDAAPIMELEERYRNIKKAERESGADQIDEDQILFIRQVLKLQKI